MTSIKIFYLIATIVGTILPWIPFLPFIMVNKFSPISIIQALYVNPATSGLTNDFFLSCIVFWIFVVIDARHLKLKNWWFILPAAPIIGLSMAFPAYLLLREYQQPKKEQESMSNM